MGGKGGVGKTVIAVNLAYALTEAGYKVGLLDADIHGPNSPKILGIENNYIKQENNKIVPIIAKGGIKVISVAFFLDEYNAVIWRGPLKHKLIQQFITDVEWGDIDLLVVDFPPGTGDEQISAAQLLGSSAKAIIVSTPQEVAILDSMRTINFCRKMNIPILGIIENMSGSIFGQGRVSKIAREQGIKFLGELKLDSSIARSSDCGKPFFLTKTEARDNFKAIADNIIKSIK